MATPHDLVGDKREPHGNEEHDGEQSDERCDAGEHAALHEQHPCRSIAHTNLSDLVPAALGVRAIESAGCDTMS